VRVVGKSKRLTSDAAVTLSRAMVGSTSITVDHVEREAEEGDEGDARGRRTGKGRESVRMAVRVVDECEGAGKSLIDGQAALEQPASRRVGVKQAEQKKQK
jgi:hypothetical protein